MLIPLVDLKAQYLSIKDEIDEAIERVITSSQFIMGKEVDAFEKEFASFCGVRHCVGVSSGTAALHLALLACGIGPGDEVITTPFTFMATAEAVRHTGAQVVFADIDLDNYNIDPIKVRSKITERTKVIMPVHLYGRPVNMQEILLIAEEYGMKVVEDAAQAHGAEWMRRRVGGIGNVGCFSFFPAKNLGAYGDAGAVVTNSEEIADKVRLLCDHGRQGKYEHFMVGYNNRLDALQAAILRVKLKRLNQWNEQRRRIADVYRSLLSECPVILPPEDQHCYSVYHLFVIRLKAREQVRQRLKEKGIQAGIHYPIPLHLQPALISMGYEEGAFPMGEIAAREVLSLPLYPEITVKQAEYVSTTVASVLPQEELKNEEYSLTWGEMT